MSTWSLSGRGILALVLLAVPSSANAGERQIRPFVGATFGGSTTFVGTDNASGRPHGIIGVNAALLGEIVGIEVDLAHAPGFFQAGDRGLVLGSRVTTLMGNIVVAAPGRKTEYGLRPYVVGGAGLMRVHIDSTFDVFPVAETMAAIDVGGGVLGFVTNRIGVCWDVRRFASLPKTTERGLSIGGEQLSFWRASMALTIRY